MRPACVDSVDAAVGCVDALRGSVSALRPRELLDALCGVEVLSRKVHATMLELVAGVEAARVAGEQGFGTTARLLAAMLDLSAGQARARVREAEQLATRRTMTGQALPARLPATAAALVAGAIGTGQLKVITQAVAALPSSLSQPDRDWAEAALAEHAQNFDPRRLSVIARRVLDQLDPDGPAPAEPDDPCPAAGELHIRDRRDGGIRIEGWLDALHGTAFRGLIEHLAAPRPLTETLPDPRTAAQRNADALVELCDLARGNDQISSAGGEPPHVTVTLDYQALLGPYQGRKLRSTLRHPSPVDPRYRMRYHYLRQPYRIPATRHSRPRPQTTPQPTPELSHQAHPVSWTPRWSLVDPTNRSCTARSDHR